MDQSVPNKLTRSGSGRLSAADAARLPDRLLDAAEALFLERGYGGTTMDKIAQSAGASTKTVYGRYRNKNEILAAVLHRSLDRAVPSLVADIEDDTERLSPRAYLSHVAGLLAARVTTPATFGIYRIVVAECARFPELGELYSEGSGRIMALISRRLVHWADAGELRLKVKPERAANAFIDLVIATPRNRAVLGRPLSPKELKAHVATAIEVLFDGCFEEK